MEECLECGLRVGGGEFVMYQLIFYRLWWWVALWDQVYTIHVVCLRPCWVDGCVGGGCYCAILVS